MLKESKSAPPPFIKFSPDSQLLAVKFAKKVEIYGINGNLKCRIQDEVHEIENIIWSQDPTSYQLLVFYKNLMHCHIFNLQD